MRNVQSDLVRIVDDGLLRVNESSLSLSLKSKAVIWTYYKRLGFTKMATVVKGDILDLYTLQKLFLATGGGYPLIVLPQMEGYRGFLWKPIRDDLSLVVCPVSMYPRAVPVEILQEVDREGWNDGRFDELSVMTIGDSAYLSDLKSSTVNHAYHKNDPLLLGRVGEKFVAVLAIWGTDFKLGDLFV